MQTGGVHASTRWPNRTYASGGSPISFLTTKLLSLLLFPLSQSILLSLMATVLVFFQLRRLAISTLLIAVGWLYLCSTAWFADTLLAGLENDFRPKALSVIPEADAIVVLGGAIRGDTHMGTMPDLGQHADRLLYAAALYKAGKAPMLLLSGGASEDARPEAQLMQEALQVMGVPRQSILLERVSRNTQENAQFSATLLNKHELQRILLVTSAFHMPRAVPLFERQGFEVIAAPTDFQRIVSAPVVPVWLPSVDDLQRSTVAIKEYVGFIVYRWRGWL